MVDYRFVFKVVDFMLPRPRLKTDPFAELRRDPFAEDRVESLVELGIISVGFRVC